MRALGILLAAAAVAGLAAAPAAPGAPVGNVERGRGHYLRYCASCHGVGAEGDGPVAPALVRRPPELRRLARRYGSPLDLDRLARQIDGREAIAAHGSREMPVWGERFEAVPSDELAHERAIDTHVTALLAYLQSIQLPDLTPPQK